MRSAWSAVTRSEVFVPAEAFSDFFGVLPLDLLRAIVRKKEDSGGINLNLNSNLNLNQLPTPAAARKRVLNRARTCRASAVYRTYKYNETRRPRVHGSHGGGEARTLIYEIRESACRFGSFVAACTQYTKVLRVMTVREWVHNSAFGGETGARRVTRRRAQTFLNVSPCHAAHAPAHTYTKVLDSAGGKTRTRWRGGGGAGTLPCAVAPRKTV